MQAVSFLIGIAVSYQHASETVRVPYNLQLWLSGEARSSGAPKRRMSTSASAWTALACARPSLGSPSWTT